MTPETIKNLTERLIDYYNTTAPFEFGWEYATDDMTAEEHFAFLMQEEGSRADIIENLALEIEQWEEEVKSDPDDEMFREDLRTAKEIYSIATENDSRTRYPVVFINCSEEPFIDRIMHGLKQAETRTRDTLKNLVGQRVYLAETGKGKPTVRCSVKIIRSEQVDREEWNNHRFDIGVNYGGSFDWKPETKSKYLYWLQAVEIVEPFTAVEGTRHGRTYMTY